jgi:hypothetical protein
VTIIVTKFMEGAWITIVVVPMLVVLLLRIKRHYNRIRNHAAQPLNLQGLDSRRPVVIIPVNSWNRVIENAIRFGLLISDDVIAAHVGTEAEDRNQLKRLWDEKVVCPASGAHFGPPALRIIESPYRRLYEPILDFVRETREAQPDRIIAVIIPELLEAHWYGYLLHNMHATRLKTLIDKNSDVRTFVISTPWYLRDR